MSLIIDSYSESNKSSDIYLGDGTEKGLYFSIGQSIVGDGNVLDSIKFYIRKVGSPSGSLFARVYAHSGVFGTSSLPTGSVLASSDAVESSGISTNYSLEVFTFSGSDKITLSNTTNYVIAIDYPSASGGNNYIMVGYDSSSPTHNGNFCYKTGGETWYASSNSDLCFYVYGESTPTIGTKYPLPAFKRS